LGLAEFQKKKSYSDGIPPLKKNATQKKFQINSHHCQTKVTKEREDTPGKFYVKQCVRRKYVSINGEGIVIGEVPSRPIDKGILYTFSFNATAFH
jgi:hypothetical protein